MLVVVIGGVFEDDVMFFVGVYCLFDFCYFFVFLFVCLGVLVIEKFFCDFGVSF